MVSTKSKVDLFNFKIIFSYITIITSLFYITKCLNMLEDSVTEKKYIKEKIQEGKKLFFISDILNESSHESFELNNNNDYNNYKFNLKENFETSNFKKSLILDIFI